MKTKLATVLFLFLGGSVGGCWLPDPAEEGLLVPFTVVDDDSLPAFELSDGTLLHLETVGDSNAPVLIVLHGGPGDDYRNYRSLKELADEYFVVLWDQRGAGLSERVPEEEIDGPQYLSDLDELGETFSPGRPFHLLGHSWGGAYATYYVQNYPDRVERLVLVEPGALTVAAAENAYSTAIEITDKDLNRFVMSSDYMLPNAYAKQDYFFGILLSNMPSPEDFANDREMDQLKSWRPGFLANKAINSWQGNFDQPTFDATVGLDAFEGATLLVGGTKSDRLGFDFQEEFHAPHFENLTLVELEGAGHYSLRFNADTLIPIIRSFLEES